MVEFNSINDKEYYEYEIPLIKELNDVLNLSANFNKLNYEDRIDYVFFIRGTKSFLRITKAMFNDNNIKDILFLYLI